MENVVKMELQHGAQQTSGVAQDAAITELGACQLALVGGGCGDVLWG